jgi:hypothetical protein
MRLNALMDPYATDGPVIVCPYVEPADRERVSAAFGLDEERGERLPFFLWHDEERIGPESAFEHCWSQFPGRDIILIHTDMAPDPADEGNAWFERLVYFADALQDAGAVACDLLFPEPTSSGKPAVQCAGGTFDAHGQIGHLGGREHEYGERYRGVRRAEWVTFGGVYLRRAALDAVGLMDRGYQWAYVRDVDYCLEMRARGWNLYQVPITLVHEENGSTRGLLEQEAYQDKVRANFEHFQRKWGASFATGRFQPQP